MQARLLKAYGLAFLGLITLGNSAFAQTLADVDRPVSIGVKCAAENGGVLEGLAVDKSKIFHRVQIRYENSIATHLEIATSSTGTAFTITEHGLNRKTDIDMRTADDLDRRYAAFILRNWERIAAPVCQGTAQSRDEALKNFQANRTAYGIP